MRPPRAEIALLSKKSKKPVEQVQVYWDKAVEIANEMDKEDDFVFIFKTCRNMLGVQRENRLNDFILKKYLESDQNDFFLFINEEMISSEFPITPEQSANENEEEDELKKIVHLP